MRSHIQSLALELESLPLNGRGGPLQPLLSCKPLNLRQLEISHYLLKPAATFLSTSNDELDQLYILLSGKATVYLGNCEPGSGFSKAHHLTEPGSMLYQPAGTTWEIHCSSPASTILLVVKLTGWMSRKSKTLLSPALVSPSQAMAQQAADAEGKTPALDGATAGLQRLNCFFLSLELGDRVPVHQHRDHGVLMLGLSGEIELGGERLASPSLMYYRGGEPHGFEVVDAAGFRGLAIEFYRDPPLSEKLRTLVRNAKTWFRPTITSNLNASS